MLIPIIKDFNNAFSYLVSNSVEKTKEVFDPVSKSLLHLSNSQSDQSNAINDIFKISWTGLKICFLFLVQTIQYIVSFQWLRDFAYLPVSIPTNVLHSNENNTFIQNFNNSVVSLIGDRQNILQRFLFSGSRITSEIANNQTITKPETGLAISDQSLPYNNFILGLPSVTHSGAPINSWSLSFLSNKWFDPLTVPVNFLSTGIESGSKSISQLSSLPEQITGDFRISNIILMSILICITTGFSSFFNSFFISFPLSLSNLLSLRYLIIQKFWAGCVSVLGMVFGEIVFMLFLILPPPFIQITLVYLESVWPYIIGLGLIIFIIFDLISNPYTNTMSLYQNNNQISSGTSSLSPSFQRGAKTKQTNIGNKLTQFLPIKLRNNTVIRSTNWLVGPKIFGFSFLLALTEQSCYFSFFSCLNLSSTGNFLDTYLFAASRSPIILFFSCVGFLIGSFLAITIYNLVIAKIMFLVASVGIKIKQYNPDFIRNWIFNRQMNFKTSIDSSIDSKNTSVPQAKFVIFRIYTGLKNSVMSRLGYLFSSIKSKDFFKSLWLGFKNIIQSFIRYLPGGKRIVFFLFPGQAQSYKSDFQRLSSRVTSFKNRNIGEFQGQITPSNNEISASLLGPQNIETRIENMLRTDSLNMYSSPSSSNLPGSSKDSLLGANPSSQIDPLSTSVNDRRNLSKNQSFGNASQLGGSSFYNKIDKVLLTCLITLSFTTIPYYSFDYLINSFFGFIPQDQILNAHSLRVNFPDYTNLLGITLSDNNSVINTDVSLYDRAHFMYGEWPNSFESLNYQGELMWTNLRDHRRQKRTRRSTRLKFKTLKTKISTSWKEFKRSSGFSGSNPSPWLSEETKLNSNLSENSQVNSNANAIQGNEDFKFKSQGPISQSVPLGSSQKQDSSDLKIDNRIDNNVSEENRSNIEKNLRNKNNLSNLFYKIFFASSLKRDASMLSNKFDNMSTEPHSWKSDSNLDNGQASPVVSLQAKQWGLTQTKSIYKNEIMPKIPEEIRRSTSLSETIKPLSTSTFIDLSGGEKYIKTYPKNWKRVITEKYYQNPIYKTILSNDLKSFLKREPLTQQLTNNQENELYFLRVKMAHYYDSLRFYFTLKEQINSTRSKADGIIKSSPQNNQNKLNSLSPPIFNKFKVPPVSPPYNTLYGGVNKGDEKGEESILSSLESRRPTTKLNSKPIISLSGLDNQTKEGSVFSQTTARENMEAGIEESLKNPPFQFKSMTSMNYRQQFKGTLKTIKQLFAISLSEPISTVSNTQNNQNFNWNTDSNFTDKESNQSINKFSAATEKTKPIEKSYKYDKYLFNEYAYPKNEFLHEEGRGLTNQKSNIYNLRESPTNSTFSSTTTKGNVSSNELSGSRGYRGIGLATKTIYNMFGSNDPFYVGWDQNLRKFVLTSRILSRSSALNYNSINFKSNLDQNKKQNQSQSNNKNFISQSDISDLTNPIKNSNNQQDLDTSSVVPIYSDFASEYKGSKKASVEAVNRDLIKDKKILKEKKPVAWNSNLNQQSVHIYRPYTSWPFFKHQLKNLPNRPYLVLYENYLNILNKRIHLFRNININDIDTKSLTFLYSYSFNNNVKKYVSQLPINIYKQSMRPSSLENLLTPNSNARSSFLWPGSTKPAWEYYFW